MRITLSIIKADVGSIGGHVTPSREMLDRIAEMVGAVKGSLVLDFYLGSTGDDISILFTHREGVNSERIHKLGFDAFMAATKVAKDQGLYGAGQDLLKDAFAGNVRGMGPAVAEMEIDERPGEPFVMFMADKTDPGAYNLPLYLSFADPMHCPGLMLSPSLSRGFRFTIMDQNYTKGDRLIELHSPQDQYDLAALLRDNQRFSIESVHTHDGQIAAAVSTTRLHNIAGKYTGKDDPVALVRAQGNFPATGEILSPYSIGHFVAGCMRGSHVMPLMPVKRNSPISYFDGPPVVSALGFCVREGKLSGPVDLFDHPFWDHIRDNVARKSVEMRQQGFSGAAMLPYDELEYGGIVEKMKVLDTRFKVREDK
ncbi:MAG: fructose 1,6-bisphosphatase [Deltaproteobacteria bacterium]|nr:fructose 1,6-bisphosphatase [Deltaproteobacteria bacterium]